MTLAPELEAHIKAALQRLAEAAQAPLTAKDTAAARKAVNAVWYAVHDASAAITKAEEETRRAFLAQIEGNPA